MEKGRGSGKEILGGDKGRGKKKKGLSKRKERGVDWEKIEKKGRFGGFNEKELQRKKL